MTFRAGRPLLFGLLAVLAWAPLPLGSNRPWSEALLGVLIGLLLAAWGAALSLGRVSRGLEPRRLAWPAALFAATCLWAALQAGGIGPAGWHHPAWAAAAEALGEALPGAIALDPDRAWDSLATLPVAAAAFFLATQLCRKRERALLLAQGITVIAGAYAALGMATHFGQIELPWFQYHADQISGSFINRNHFATFLGLGFVAAWTLFLQVLLLPSRDEHGMLRQRGRDALEAFLDGGWLYLLLAVLIGSAILLTRSRGGMLAAMVGVTVLLALAFRGRRFGSRRRALIAAPVLLTLVAIGVASGGDTWTRLTEELTLEGNDRLMASGLALDAIAEHPFTGIGWGGYEADFRIRRTAAFDKGRDQLENDYLQQVLELGLIPALAFLAVPAMLGWICLRGVRERRRDQTLPSLGVAATALVATHALVDFSLRIPAPLLLYAVLMGMAVAQSFRTDGAKP